MFNTQQQMEDHTMNTVPYLSHRHMQQGSILEIPSPAPVNHQINHQLNGQMDHQNLLSHYPRTMMPLQQQHPLMPTAQLLPQFQQGPTRNPSEPMRPTFIGHLETTYDAMLLVEACLSGALHHVNRRPHDKERPHCIVSGSVFVYEESASGIKRWTDGNSWSPSRIMGNFLIYREIKDGLPPSERKVARKKSNKSGRPGGISKTRRSKSELPRNAAELAEGVLRARNQSPDEENPEWRVLVGSLIDSYHFKLEGLCKKTVSVKLHGVNHHIVSYYDPKDIMSGKLQTPSKIGPSRFPGVRPDLLSVKFRGPIDGLEAMMPHPHYIQSFQIVRGVMPVNMAQFPNLNLLHPAAIPQPQPEPVQQTTPLPQIQFDSQISWPSVTDRSNSIHDAYVAEIAYPPPPPQTTSAPEAVFQEPAGYIGIPPAPENTTEAYHQFSRRESNIYSMEPTVQTSMNALGMLPGPGMGAPAGFRNFGADPSVTQQTGFHSIMAQDASALVESAQLQDSPSSDMGSIRAESDILNDFEGFGSMFSPR